MAEARSLPRVLVVTGTNTGVGKTIATAALAVALRARGSSPGNRQSFVGKRGSMPAFTWWMRMFPWNGWWLKATAFLLAKRFVMWPAARARS